MVSSTLVVFCSMFGDIFGNISSTNQAIFVGEFSAKNYSKFGADLAAFCLSFGADFVKLHLATCCSKFGADLTTFF